MGSHLENSVKKKNPKKNSVTRQTRSGTVSHLTVEEKLGTTQ